MQLSTKPEIQIRESGRMYCLCSEDRVIGFAASLDFAVVRAKELGGVFSAQSQNPSVSAVDEIESLTFGSPKAGVWLVEVLDGRADGGAFQIAAFPTAAAAGQLRDQLEAHHQTMPQSDADGEWSEAQIAWFKSHPAPVVSALGGDVRIRYQGVH